MSERTGVVASERRELSPVVRWGIALVAVGVAHLANWAIPNGMFSAPFFITAVMVAAHFGGPGPAILAFFTGGALLDYFYIPPFYSFSIRADVLPSLLQFVVPSAVGAWFIQKRKDVEILFERETAVAKRLQGEQTLPEIGRSVLDYLAPELGAQIAAFYTVEPDGAARRRAGYAFDDTGAPETIGAGQGVMGQAIADKHPQILAVPPDYLTVRSSLGSRRPTTVVVMPATDGKQTQAVLELGFPAKLDPSVLRTLDRVAEPLAIAVRTAAYRTRLQDLLEETRRQAEELKAHDDELRAANEELEERGQAMALTQRQLQDQQVELEQTNEMLQEQAKLLEQQNDDLAHAHEAVRLKSESADRANRTKSEFLANMSHELRTPLNSSLILAKLLTENRDGNLTVEQIRFAETIYGAGNDLLAMIDDILDLAKIEAGKLDVRIEDVPLGRLRSELSRTFEPVAAERKLRFEVRVADDAPAFIRTDGQRLAQILKNLLSNALKFTENGEVSLTVTAQADKFRFVVRDSGVGIHESQLGMIFDAFQQADGTTNRKHGGTGLGLSISRDLAHFLGGEIAVSSERGKGSTFTLTLPTAFTPPKAGVEDAPVSPRPSTVNESVFSLSLPRSLDRLPPAPSATRSPNDPPSSPHQGRTILVIEDDARFAEIVVGLASEMQFHATVASTADEALRIATTSPPKGIVLDMKLPDHSGLSVLDRLKRDPRTRHIPVHVMSVADYTRAALEMGAVGYMLKPVQREQIKAALQNLESQFTRSLRRLLVVEDDLPQRDAICQLLGGDNVEIIAVGTVKEALEQLRLGSLDCVVTDLALPDASGYDLLETMAMDEAYSFPTVVVYTGRSLTADDEQRLRKYSSSIIVKGARSPERLLDEVTLFLHQVESTLPPERQRMLRRARHREAIFEDRTVLIVEDDVRNVFALTSALEPKGMKVLIARNGVEGLETLEQNPNVDLVLMDVMMPEMDGIEATRAIRRQPKWAKLPIITLTAKAMKDDQERCLQAGASDYMPKPLDVDMLLSLLRVWFAR
ncbi:MAG TPA: response regulator [Polyangiaceae bacterium]|nr:response regulator [Polyangiaceae bacterium]